MTGERVKERYVLCSRCCSYLVLLPAIDAAPLLLPRLDASVYALPPVSSAAAGALESKCQ
jgi:hypothetical protein